MYFFLLLWNLFVSLLFFVNIIYTFEDLHLFTFQTLILVPTKYIIHFIIYFKIQGCLEILSKIT